MKFLVINGPNLNLTQFTEPGMEGQIDFNTLLDYIEAGCAQMDVQVDFFQSNHEGDLIDEIQSAAGRADGSRSAGRCTGRACRRHSAACCTGWAGRSAGRTKPRCHCAGELKTGDKTDAGKGAAAVV